MARASTATVLGQSTFVRGRVTGSGDLTIEGRVEGDVTIDGGEVTVESTALIAGNITARRIVVKGALKGDLTADEVVAIESGAKVVGDLRAPRIAIASGGLVRGHVQTGKGNAAPAPRARASATTTTTPATPAARAATPAAARAVPVAPRSAPKARAAAPAPAREREREPVKVHTNTNTNTNTNNHRPAPAQQRAALGRIPPPPVVPVLKKGTKAIQKKR